MSSMRIERETFGSEHMATGFSCWIRKSDCFVCILLKAYYREKISECWAKLLPGILLIGTGHGLSVLEQKDGKVINFNSKTGFPLTLVNRKSMHVSLQS